MGKAWTQLKDVPMPLLSNIIQPIYVLTKNNSHFILIAASNVDELIKYDLLKNKYILIKSIDTKTSIHLSSLAINANNSDIFAMSVERANVVLINIDNKQNIYKWMINNDDEKETKQIELETAMISCYIFDNEIHIIGGNKKYTEYLSYNTINRTFKSLYRFEDIINLTDYGMIYLPLFKNVIVFGGKSGNNYHDEIYLYDCTISKMNKLGNILMPHKMAKFGYILYNNRYILMFGGETKKSKKLNCIYILDTTMMNKPIINHWILHKQKCPIKSSFYSIITNNGNIHLFERDSDEHKHWLLHIKKLNISLNDKNNDYKEDEIILNEMSFCEQEFVRFLEESLPKGKDYKNYLNKFIKYEMNNVRYIHALNKNILINDIGMKEFHQIVLLPKINEYKMSYSRFKDTFKKINMFEKYYGFFDKYGIISYWSFYHHINNIHDMEKIVADIDKNHVQILWTALSKETGGNQQNAMDRLDDEGQQTDFI